MKAGYGKTVRPVCAADGGKLFIGRLLRPDSWEADEQSRSNGGGVGGAKGGGHGEREPAKHIPGAAPETCVTGAGARTTSRNAFCRQTPKVGAACGNSACADLCGGRPVTAVPTANPRHGTGRGHFSALCGEPELWPRRFPHGSFQILPALNSCRMAASSARLVTPARVASSSPENSAGA